MSVKQRYNDAELYVDIIQHMPTLRFYAEKVSHITEFGVRQGGSISAFLMGRPKKMISYDINNCIPDPAASDFGKFAARNGTEFDFIQGDSLQIEIEPTDLLFIDTEHTFEQLATELKRHSEKVRKYIICHDTVTFPGCMRAIDEFVRDMAGQWKVKEHFGYNNGLTVLERVMELSI